MATIPIVAAVKDFDKLTRELAAAKEATKQARLEAKQLKETQDGMVTSGSLATMAKQAASFAAGMLGVNSASAIAQKIIAAAKEDFRQLVDMQNRAAAAQSNVSDAVGEYLLNAALSSTDEGKQLLSFAQIEGQKLGAGGTGRVLDAATATMNQVPTASMGDLKTAVGYGIEANQISSKFDIGKFAIGLLKVQQELGGSMEQASNLLLTLGARSGGDFGSIVGQLGKLKALSGSATATNLPDILAAFGFMTHNLGDETGQTTTTTLGGLLSKVSTRDIKIGGRSAKLDATTGIDRVVELAQRIESGDFGDPTEAIADIAKSIGKDSSSVKMTFGAFAKDMAQFDEARARMGEALVRPDSMLTELRQRKLALMPESASIEKTRAAAGAASASSERSTIEAEWARVRERMGLVEDKPGFLQQYGIRNSFDWGKDEREMAAIYSDQNPIEWEAQERRRLLARRLRQMAPQTAMSGAGLYSGTDVTDPFRGMSEEQMLKFAAMRGGVDPKGGFSAAESQMLQTVGISTDTIAQWNQMFIDGLTEKLAEAFVKAMREAQAQPSAGALNPGN